MALKKQIAVIGFGGQGGWHCDQLKTSDVAACAGIYDISETRRKGARDKGFRVYESKEALLTDPAVEAVVVSTPNDVHPDLVVEALKSGKHVICEKPVAITVAEFDRMARAAEETGMLFTVHQNRRWDVDFLAVNEAVNSGDIGGLLRIESRVHGSRGIPSDWRSHKPQGGGMILDWGVHLIDQLLQIFPGKVTTVYCECTHYTNREVDDGFRLSLTFDDGKTALVEVGTYNFLPMPRFYVQCEKGTVLLSDWRKPAHVARLKAWNEKEVVPVQTAAGITKTMAPRDDITIDEYDLPRPHSDVHDFYRNVCLAMDGKADPLITLPQVRRVLQVMEAAFLSDQTRQTVTLSDC